MSDFSFSSLIKPGQGTEIAMRKELEKRREQEQATKRFGYRYGGPADLVLAHGTFFTGRELPDEYRHLRGPEQHCHSNSMLTAAGHPELRYFTGWYMVGGSIRSHSWLVAPDGGVLEVTFPDEQRMNELGCPPAQRRLRHDNGTSVPWMPCASWGYWGVEYSTEFVAHCHELRGLPILDIDARDSGGGLPLYLADEELPMFKAQYTPDGFEVTETPEALDKMWKGEDDDEEWEDDEDEDETQVWP